MASLPTSFRAARYFAFSSDPSCLSIAEVPFVAPEPGVLVVRVAVAAINPIDVKVLAGHLAGAGWRTPFPFTPGYDFSGTVAAIGEGISGFAVGDKVFAVNWGVGKHDDPSGQHIAGAFAEYISLPASKVSHIPAGLSFTNAAAVALVGSTAHQALFHFLKLSAGARVLIIGGASAVGLLAIQLAKLRGIWVTTTTSSRNAAFVGTLGADKVINYNTHSWVEDPELRGIDAVLDMVGEPGAFEKSKTILKRDGAFLSIASFDAGFNPSAHPPLSFAAFICLINSVAVQDEVAQLLAQGRLRLPIQTRYPFTLEGLQAAFTAQAGGASTGKLLIEVQPQQE
eukprot:gnl/Spiro4/5914_TR3025_c0_g1_i1.p1 gnl/Spiro4/5914_TR3025_c0_g1~~gnl/Spiro4/5914_TR3025_c0_g1_i1.p1  ORF type:complete len:340 (-),score=91.23 gnl/Spiro4/5914_TR3025_c0_g1_i1:66-1085(-)